MKISAKEAQRTIKALLQNRKKRKAEYQDYSSSDESEMEYADPQVEEPAAVDVIQVVHPISDELAEMEKIAQSAPFEPYDLNPYGMPLYDSRSSNLYDWEDLRAKTDVYRLIKLTNSDIVRLGVRVFNSLSTNTTKRNICSLMLLAFNLRDTNNRSIFETVDKRMVGKETDFINIEDENLSDEVPLVDWGFRLNSTERQRAISFCYIACSFLRLYTKSVENFKKIPAYITDKFTNFYDFEIAVVDFDPADRVIVSVKNQFNINEILRNTFYTLLYAGESTKIGSNLKEFLYVIHTSYTGLHSYTLFMRCMDSLDVSNIQLASVLDCVTFRRPLKALVQVFKNLTGCRFEDNKRRQMWKFARIFEPRFLHDLQTKNCVTFAYALAYLYTKSSVITGNQNPLNIVQFKGISEYQRNTGALAAVRAQAGLGRNLMTKNMKIVSQLVRREIKVKKPRRA